MVVHGPAFEEGWEELREGLWLAGLNVSEADDGLPLDGGGPEGGAREGGPPEGGGPRGSFPMSIMRSQLTLAWSSGWGTRFGEIWGGSSCWPLCSRLLTSWVDDERVLNFNINYFQFTLVLESAIHVVRFFVNYLALVSSRENLGSEKCRHWLLLTSWHHVHCTPLTSWICALLDRWWYVLRLDLYFLYRLNVTRRRVTEDGNPEPTNKAIHYGHNTRPQQEEARLLDRTDTGNNLPR